MKLGKTALVAVAAGLLVASFMLAAGVHQGGGASQLGIEAPTSGGLSVTYTVILSSSTGFLQHITHREVVSINVTVPEAPVNSSRAVGLLFIGGSPQPFNSSGVTYVTGPPASLPSYEPAHAVGPFEEITFTLPNAAGTYTMGATGTLSETTVFGESGADIPLQDVSTDFGLYPTSYELVLQVPAGMQLQTLFSYTKGLSFIGKVPYQSFNYNGSAYVSTSYFLSYFNPNLSHQPLFANVVTALYASESLYLYATEIAALLVVVLLYPYWSRYLGRVGPFTSRLMNWVRGLSSKKLLTIFVLACLLTVGVSFAFGPNPSQRVYVMGTGSAALAIGRDIKANTTLTPVSENQVSENSATVSTLGGFAAIVVVNPTLNNPSWDLVPYATSDTTITLAGPTRVIILNGAPDFVTVAEQLYAGNVVNATQDSQVIASLNSMSLRQNPLGIDISPRVFRYAEQLTAVLSFVLAFLAMAFLSSKVAEVGTSEGWIGIAEALGYAFFAFAFLQMIYIACSVFLAVPLGLHSGNAQVTAAGTLPGLAGGGSRPRELAGILGFVFGALTMTRRSIRIDRLALVIVLGLVLLLVLDPLTNGLIFHELVIALSAGSTQGTAAQTIDFVGGLLFNIGNAFGSLASQWYFIQRGLILYFAGAVSFVIVPKLQKTTGTILLLFSALLAGEGIVRVADMIPLKTMASTIPGFMAGLLVISIFLLFSSFEKTARKLFARV